MVDFILFHHWKHEWYCTCILPFLACWCYDCHIARHKGFGLGLHIELDMLSFDDKILIKIPAEMWKTFCLRTVKRISYQELENMNTERLSAKVANNRFYRTHCRKQSDVFVVNITRYSMETVQDAVINFIPSVWSIQSCFQWYKSYNRPRNARVWVENKVALIS